MTLKTFVAPAGVTSVTLSDGRKVAVVNGEISVDEKFTNELESAGYERADLAAATSLTQAQVVAAIQGASGGAYYAAQNGVTGINDGSRDDAPLLLTAYNAAVAAGAKCLVLPVGTIWLNSFIDVLTYPNSYVIQVAANDFTVYVPPGCNIRTSHTAAPTAASSGIGIFQFTGQRSGLIFDGTAEHTVPPASVTPTNYWHVGHLAAGSDSCFLVGRGIAKGFSNPYVSVFDNSSTTFGRIQGLRVTDCLLGIVQSSGGTSVSGEITSVRVKNAWQTGVSCAGAVNKISDVIVDNRAITQTGSPSLLAITGPIEQCSAQDIQLFGSPAGVGQGLFVSPTNQSNKSSFQCGTLIVTNTAIGVRLEGVARIPKFKNIHMNNVGRCWYKNPGQVNNGDAWVDDFTAAACSYGFKDTNSSQGRWRLRNCEASQAFLQRMFEDTALANVINPINVQPAVPIANRIDIQRVVATAGGTVTATTGIDNLTLELVPAGTLATLTVVWPTSPVDGQIFRLRSSQAVTALTVTGTVAGAPTALTAGYYREFIYDSTAGTWL